MRLIVIQYAIYTVQVSCTRRNPLKSAEIHIKDGVFHGILRVIIIKWLFHKNPRKVTHSNLNKIITLKWYCFEFFPNNIYFLKCILISNNVYDFEIFTMFVTDWFLSSFQNVIWLQFVVVWWVFKLV